MPLPSLVTTWPTEVELAAWLGPDAVAATTANLFPEVVADATATIYGQIDTEKLPVDPDECPRPIARAIVLEAARLLYRREAPHGAAAFGEVAIRLRSVDVDVERLLHDWGVDPEP